MLVRYIPVLFISYGKKLLDSEAAQHNNCAFCDKSTKFGTEVENQMTIKFG